MPLVHTDTVVRIPPNTTPNYGLDNPLERLLGLIQGVRLAAGRQHYPPEHLQYLFPFDHLDMHGPSAPASDVLAAEQQDVKTDFQKQNVRRFTTSSTQLVRGWAVVGGWTGPFLQLSYDAGPESVLARASRQGLGASVRMWIRVGAAAIGVPLTVPYDAETGRYTIELWGYGGGDLRAQLDARGRDALDRGALVARPDLVKGGTAELALATIAGRPMSEVARDHTLHPLIPLHVEVAWSDASGAAWDSLAGANYQYEFNMLLRGWDHFLEVGESPNPHGGIGSLQYRNLLSNYFRYEGSGELARKLEPWNFNAWGRKDHGNTTEPFFAVDYMDLHRLRPECAIGLHRHRDNQEVFLMLQGQAFMAIGDWARMPTRERCIEVRTLRPGHLAMLKGGQLHGLINTTAEDISLFMFGGYD